MKQGSKTFAESAGGSWDFKSRSSIVKLKSVVVWSESFPLRSSGFPELRTSPESGRRKLPSVVAPAECPFSKSAKHLWLDDRMFWN